MRFLYPSAPFQTKAPDEIYADEHAAALAAGFPVSLFSYEEFCAGGFHPFPVFSPGETICYRGCSLTLKDYQRLSDGIRRLGARSLTAPDAYKLCHYLPSWYTSLRDHTPKTLFFMETANVEAALREKGWTRCFLKDYVKSLSIGGDSFVTSLDKIPEITRKMKKYRGMIEGGLCAREIEDFLPSSERRYFIFKGKPYAAEGEIPDLALLAAKLIPSPFFSVDIIQRKDGTPRIVDLGDGQVSALKNWSADEFINILK